MLTSPFRFNLTQILFEKGMKTLKMTSFSMPYDAIHIKRKIEFGECIFTFKNDSKITNNTIKG